MLKDEIQSLRNELKELFISKQENNKKEDDLIMDTSFKNNNIKTMLNYINRVIFTRGMIVSWCGELNKIPRNWAVCDGTNGTPDLRNRFIIGAGQDIKFGDIGGNSSIQLQKANLPPIGGGYFSCDSHHGAYHHSTNGIIKFTGSYSVSTKNGKDDSWGSNFKIDLNEGMNSSPINILNPYFALFYIMKL